MECAKVTAGARKPKKKQVKDELDRIKQAEKKKRRLEKALATSAAIRAELEKKKLKRKEEQERLDEEGAAIAEAVALQVLLDEDSDLPSKDVLKEDEGLTLWDHARGNIDFLVGPIHSGVCYNHFPAYSCEENIGVDSVDGRYCGPMWNLWGDSLATWAISSLKIADDACVDALVFDGMLRG